MGKKVLEIQLQDLGYDSMEDFIKANLKYLTEGKRRLFEKLEENLEKDSL